jgi:hypothetical protein
MTNNQNCGIYVYEYETIEDIYLQRALGYPSGASDSRAIQEESLIPWVGKY